MIPNEDQLRAIVELREGDLAEIPFAVLLHALSAYRRSVLLEIERGPLLKSIIFESGVPVDCRSNLAHETLSRFMVTRGDFSEEEGQDYFHRSVSRGMRFGQFLIVEGVISASELYRALQQNLAKKLLDGFTWRAGTFRLKDEHLEVESPLKVNPPQLVVTGISKFALDEEVNEAIGPMVGKKLFLHPSPPHSLGDIRLSNNQKQLTELLREGRRIDELAADTAVAFNEIMRLLYSLAVLGIVVAEEGLPAATATEKPVSPEGDLLPAVEVEPVAEAPRPMVDDALATRALRPLEDLAPGLPVSEQDRDALIGAYLQYRAQDAFDLLGLPETASPGDVDDSYLALCRRFAPWKFERLPDLAEKARDLFLAGGRAFGELCDRDRRNALIVRRQTLRTESEKKPAEDRFLIRSELLDSQVQFRKGKALARAGRYREALQQFEFAHDCDPQNSAYRAELAYCRFLDSPPSAERSLSELRETLRIDPKCALAIYFSGMIEGEIGEYQAAEEKLRRAIKLMMPDRRPIEALKALQAKQQKKKKNFF